MQQTYVDVGRGNFSRADLHRGPWATTRKLVDRQLCSPATDAIRALNAEALIDTQLGLFSAAKGLCAQIVHLERAAMLAPDPRLGSAAATPNRKHRRNRSHTAIVRAAG
ncbi:hypothetical protein LJR290_005809 [Variovorax sp. LjRoot290]|uniref:hypothetical protein n=1 Tax=unclassified Variovorax TaxID=663243 RepID=UPI003ECF18D4